MKEETTTIYYLIDIFQTIAQQFAASTSKLLFSIAVVSVRTARKKGMKPTISSFKTRYTFICAILFLYSSEILCLLTTTNLIRSTAFSRRKQRSLEATVESIESNFEKSWVENNIIAKSVKHSSFDWVCGTLRGLQATTGQFKKGSAVISVPIGETLSSSDTGEQGCPSGLEEVWKELKATSRVSLLLLQQWSNSKEKKTKFTSYIEALPAPGSLGTPFHWTDECLDSFPYKPLVVSVKLQRQKWAELYSKIQNSGSLKGVSYERFVWAMEIVRSRAFTGSIRHNKVKT